MNEKLIESVRNHKVLFDTNDPDYLKSKLRDQIWCGIAAELNLKNGNEAKDIWTKLRNCHRDALRRRKKTLKSGAPATVIKQWKYQKHMEFLVPYMANRPREGNLNDSEGSEETEHQLQDTKSTKEMPESPQNSVETEYVMNDNDNVGHISDTQHENIKENTERYKRSADEVPSTSDIPTSASKNKKNKKYDLSNLIRQSMQRREKRAEERALERKKMETVVITSVDHLYHFYMSMYEITKKLPPAYQHTVRNNVFHAVSQAEAEYLQIHDQSQRLHQQECYQTSQNRIPFPYSIQAHPSNSTTSTHLPSSSNSTQLSVSTPNSDSNQQHHGLQAVTYSSNSNPPTPQSHSEYLSESSPNDTSNDNIQNFWSTFVTK